MRNVERLCLAHFWVAFAAFLGRLRCSAPGRCGCAAPWAPTSARRGNISCRSRHMASSMAYVLTTFFIMGFGYFVAVTALNRPLPGKAWAWAAFWMAIIGVVMALMPIATGPGIGALHLLSAAHRKPLVLYRARAGRGRLPGSGAC